MNISKKRAKTTAQSNHHVRPSFDRSGSALVVVCVFVVLGAVIASSALRLATIHSRNAHRQMILERAHFVAEAGVEAAANKIQASEGYLPNTVTKQAGLGGGKYKYTISKVGRRTYRVSSLGLYNGVGRRINVNRVYYTTYAKYSMWMRVNGNIWFFPGEQFHGHVHSDDFLRFWSHPVLGGSEFFGAVTSLQPSFYGSTSHVTFHKGLTLNSDQGSMASIDFDKLETLAKTPGINGLVLDGATEIQFKGDQMIVSNDRMGWEDQPVNIREDQLVYIRDATSGDQTTRAGIGRLYGGVIDGRITLVTDDDILLYDDITYRNDPRDDQLELELRDFSEPSTDALGLISKDDVWIAESSPPNLTLFAAILAAGVKEKNSGSFGVLNYQDLPPKGYLTIHGGIVQDVRGVVNLHSSSALLHGYAKHYTFDNRFELTAPPYYPAAGETLKFEEWSDGPA